MLAASIAGFAEKSAILDTTAPPRQNGRPDMPTPDAPVLASPALPDSRASVRLVIWLAASWLLLLVIGFFVLRSPDALAASNRVSTDRAIFTTANIGTMAGFTADYARPDDFSTPVKSIFVLQTLASTLLSLAGGGALLARLLKRPETDSQITAIALGLIVLAFVLGIGTAQHGDALTAGFRGITALGCGGLIFGEMAIPGPAFSLLVVPLSVLGSFGVLVVGDLFRAAFFRKPLHSHTWRVLLLTAVMFLIGTGLLLLADPPGEEGFRPTLLAHDALFWSARGWGDPVTYASGWNAGTIWLVMAIIVLGSGTAGTAGNFGLGWLLTLPKSVKAVAYNGLTVAALQAAITLAVLANFEPTLSPVRRALLVASAIMNVGLSHEALNITGVSLIALAVCMIVAKLLPLVVIAFAVGRGSADGKELT